MKTCPKCNQAKPLEEFNRDRHNTDGRQQRCRTCANEYRRAYYRASAPFKPSVWPVTPWPSEPVDISDVPQKLRHGVCRPLEDAANFLLNESLKGVDSHEAKSDILTPWKESERRSHEVYAASGAPDAAVRKGMFGRAVNKTRPDLNARDAGSMRSSRTGYSTANEEDDPGWSLSSLLGESE
jgi:hypothetical protein